MINLPIASFNMADLCYRKVAKDCHITTEHNYYSVPSKYVGKEVTVSIDSDLVKIYSDDHLIATHARSKGRGVFTTNTNHYAEYKKHCPGFKEYDEKCQEQMQKLGTHCVKMLEAIKTERKRDWHRPVKGIIALKKLYSDDVIDKACCRALHYGVYSYKKIKDIIESNSYNLPLHQNNYEGFNAKSA